MASIESAASPATLEAPQKDSKALRRTKIVGIALFMFFLIKGLAWLAVPAVLAWMAI